MFRLDKSFGNYIQRQNPTLLYEINDVVYFHIVLKAIGKLNKKRYSTD